MSRNTDDAFQKYIDRANGLFGEQATPSSSGGSLGNIARRDSSTDYGFLPDDTDAGGIDNAFGRGVGSLSKAVGAGLYELGAEDTGIDLIRSGQRRVDENPMDAEEIAFQRQQSQEGVAGALWNYVTNPDMLANVIAESAPLMPVSVAGAAVGSLAGPAGTVVGAGLGSLATEYGNSLLQTFEENGVNIRDEGQLRSAFGNRELMSEARRFAVTRGVPIATFDALSMGIGGKVFGPVYGRVMGMTSRPRKVLAGAAGTVAELGVQGAAGGAGEAGAQLLSEGRISDPSAIAAEIAAEFGTGGVEAVTGPVLRGERNSSPNYPDVPSPDELVRRMRPSVPYPELPPPLDVPPGGPPEPGRTGRTGLEPAPRTVPPRQLEDRSATIDVTPEGVALPREEALRRANNPPPDQTIRVTPSGTAILPDSMSGPTSGATFNPSGAPERTARAQAERERQAPQDQTRSGPAMAAGRANLQGQLAEDIDRQEAADRLRARGSISPEQTSVAAAQHDTLLGKYRELETKRNELEAESRQFQEQAQAGNKQAQARLKSISKRTDSLDAEMSSVFDEIVDIRDQFGMAPEAPLAPIGEQPQSAAPNQQPGQDAAEVGQETDTEKQDRLFEMFRAFEYLKQRFPEAVPGNHMERMAQAFKNRNFDAALQQADELVFETEQAIQMSGEDIWSGFDPSAGVQSTAVKKNEGVRDASPAQETNRNQGAWVPQVRAVERDNGRWDYQLLSGDGRRVIRESGTDGSYKSRFAAKDFGRAAAKKFGNEQTQTSQAPVVTNRPQVSPAQPTPVREGQRQTLGLNRPPRDTTPGQNMDGSGPTPQADDPQTQTPNFKKWFRRSKARDLLGKPLRLYHATTSSFKAFSRAGEGTNEMEPRTAGGALIGNRKMFFFTPNVNVANDYTQGPAVNESWDKVYETEEGANIMPVFVSMQRPKIIDAAGRSWRWANQQATEAYDSGKYDGAVIRQLVDMYSGNPENGKIPSDVFVAFDEKQVKSAISNNGNWSRENPNLSESRRAPQAATDQAPGQGYVAYTASEYDNANFEIANTSRTATASERADAGNLIAPMTSSVVERGGKAIYTSALDGGEVNVGRGASLIKDDSALFDALSVVWKDVTDAFVSRTGFDPSPIIRAIVSHNSRRGPNTAQMTITTDPADLTSMFLSVDQNEFANTKNETVARKLRSQLAHELSHALAGDGAYVKEKIDAHLGKLKTLVRGRSLKARMDYSEKHTDLAAIDPELFVDDKAIKVRRTIIPGRRGDMARASVEVTNLKTEQMSPVMREIIVKYLNDLKSNPDGSSQLIAEFRYPIDAYLQNLADGYGLNSTTPSEEAGAFLSSEVFAQLSSLYVTQPEALRAALPIAHAYISKKVSFYANNRIQPTPSNAGRDGRVPGAVRPRGSERGAVRQNTQRDEGRGSGVAGEGGAQPGVEAGVGGAAGTANEGVAQEGQPDGGNSPRSFRLDVNRTDRQVDQGIQLTDAEISLVRESARTLGVPDDVTQKLLDQAVKLKQRNPESAGWAQPRLIGVRIPKNKTADKAVLAWENSPYRFNIPNGVGRAPNQRDAAWVQRVATSVQSIIDNIYARAEAGDANAQVIVGHASWYRNVTEVLRREFGANADLLADLLGATSPNTAVDINWRFSIDAMRQFVRGDFNADLKKFADYVAAGGQIGKYPAKDKIKQINGKLYGMNSTHAMAALLNTWRQIHPDQAPKARNFALNLIGQSDLATIDVWAARFLRRAANAITGNLPRIPIYAENPVDGKWNASGTDITSEFGFGVAVLEEVASRMRASGKDITAPDLQAVAWFIEKELWAQNNWSNTVGEGGSFEEIISANPMERYVAGWSVQQGERVPNAETSSAAQSRVMSTLSMDSTVVSARVLPTKGLYGGTVEESFDTEWTVEKGKHDPSLVLAEIAKLAKENSQYDIFVSKILGPTDDSQNARPGVEIYFKTQRDLDAVMPILEQFTSKGVDGFTLAVDPRSQGGQYIGVRLQFIPEISMRWDDQFRKDVLTEGFLENLMTQKTAQLDRIVSQVSGMEGVAFAKVFQYDTIVVGQENYDAFIDRAASGQNSSTGSGGWFGQPLRQAIERAASRLNRDGGEVSTGGVPDAGGAVPVEGRAEEEVNARGPPTRDASPGVDSRRSPRFDRPNQPPPAQPTGRLQGWLDSVRKKAEQMQPTPMSTTNGAGRETASDHAIRRFQDKYLRLKRWEQAVAKERGWARLPDWMSAYSREEVMHGKVTNDLNLIEKDFIEPLSKLMSEKDITIDELGLYMYAKHAQERNEYIASINDRMPDGGSGMSTADAQAILSEVGRLGLTNDMDSAAQYVYDMLESGRNMLEQSGLEDRFVVGSWRGAYDSYVPLKGFASDEILTDGESKVSIGRGLSVGGRESMRALGRRLEAYNPVATAVRDVSAKVVRARKNEVGKAFLSFVRANPNPEAWQILNGNQVERYFNEATGKVDYRAVSPMTQKFRSDRVFEVKRGGQTEYILINDELLAKAMMNVGENQVTEMGAFVLKTFGRVSNFVAGVNTRWNPVWTLANAPRDFTAGLLNLAAEADLNNGLLNGQKIAKQVASDVLSMKPHKAFWKAVKGTPSNDPEVQAYIQYANEFLADGGATGWVRFRTAEEEMARLEKMANRRLSGPGAIKAAGEVTVGFLEHVNDTVENAVRLSAYRHAREAGVSRQKAASLAKNLTVNFNRRGEASVVLNGLYMFWNASIQGSAQVFRTLTSRKARKMMAGIAAFHSAVAVYNMMAMDGDDEDYEQIPEYMKATGLPIYMGGKLLVIPLPYGYSAFSYGATKITEMIAGKAKPSEASLAIVGKLADDFLPIRVPEGDYKLLRAVAPTGTQWFVDLAANQNYFGGSIRNERFPGQGNPDSDMGRRSTHPMWIGFAKFLNSATGGEDKVSGLIDLNPDDIKYFFEFIGGGAARTTFSSIDFLSDPTDIFSAPFVSKLVKDLGSREYARMYYEQIDDLMQIKAESKSRKGADKLEWDRQYRNELRIADLVRAYETRLKSLRKQRTNVEDSNQPDEIKSKQVERIEEQMSSLYEEFVKRSRNIKSEK